MCSVSPPCVERETRLDCWHTHTETHTMSGLAAVIMGSSVRSLGADKSSDGERERETERVCVCVCACVRVCAYSHHGQRRRTLLWDSTQSAVHRCTWSTCRSVSTHTHTHTHTQSIIYNVHVHVYTLYMHMCSICTYMIVHACIRVHIRTRQTTIIGCRQNSLQVVFNTSEPCMVHTLTTHHPTSMRSQ